VAGVALTEAPTLWEAGAHGSARSLSTQRLAAAAVKGTGRASSESPIVATASSDTGMSSGPSSASIDGAPWPPLGTTMSAEVQQFLKQLRTHLATMCDLPIHQYAKVGIGAATIARPGPVHWMFGMAPGQRAVLVQGFESLVQLFMYSASPVASELGHPEVANTVRDLFISTLVVRSSIVLRLVSSHFCRSHHKYAFCRVAVFSFQTIFLRSLPPLGVQVSVELLRTVRDLAVRLDQLMATMNALLWLPLRIIIISGMCARENDRRNSGSG